MCPLFLVLFFSAFQNCFEIPIFKCLSTILSNAARDLKHMHKMGSHVRTENHSLLLHANQLVSAACKCIRLWVKARCVHCPVEQTINPRKLDMSDHVSSMWPGLSWNHARSIIHSITVLLHFYDVLSITSRQHALGALDGMIGCVALGVTERACAPVWMMKEVMAGRGSGMCEGNDSPDQLLRLWHCFLTDRDVEMGLGPVMGFEKEKKKRATPKKRSSHHPTTKKQEMPWRQVRAQSVAMGKATGVDNPAAIPMWFKLPSSLASGSRREQVERTLMGQGRRSGKEEEEISHDACRMLLRRRPHVFHVWEVQPLVEVLCECAMGLLLVLRHNQDFVRGALEVSGKRSEGLHERVMSRHNRLASRQSNFPAPTTASSPAHPSFPGHGTHSHHHHHHHRHHRHASHGHNPSGNWKRSAKLGKEKGRHSGSGADSPQRSSEGDIAGGAIQSEGNISQSTSAPLENSPTSQFGSKREDLVFTVDCVKLYGEEEQSDEVTMKNNDGGSEGVGNSLHESDTAERRGASTKAKDREAAELRDLSDLKRAGPSKVIPSPQLPFAERDVGGGREVGLAPAFLEGDRAESFVRNVGKTFGGENESGVWGEQVSAEEREEDERRLILVDNELEGDNTATSNTLKLLGRTLMVVRYLVGMYSSDKQKQFYVKVNKEDHSESSRARENKKGSKDDVLRSGRGEGGGGGGGGGNGGREGGHQRSTLKKLTTAENMSLLVNLIQVTSRQYSLSLYPSLVVWSFFSATSAFLHFSTRRWLRGTHTFFHAIFFIFTLSLLFPRSSLFILLFVIIVLLFSYSHYPYPGQVCEHKVAHRAIVAVHLFSDICGGDWQAFGGWSDQCLRFFFFFFLFLFLLFLLLFLLLLILLLLLLFFFFLFFFFFFFFFYYYYYFFFFVFSFSVRVQ